MTPRVMPFLLLSTVDRYMTCNDGNNNTLLSCNNTTLVAVQPMVDCRLAWQVWYLHFQTKLLRSVDAVCLDLCSAASCMQRSLLAKASISRRRHLLVEVQQARTGPPHAVGCCISPGCKAKLVLYPPSRTVLPAFAVAS